MELIIKQKVINKFKVNYRSKIVLLLTFIFFFGVSSYGSKNKLDTIMEHKVRTMPSSISIDTITVKNIEPIGNTQSWYQDDKMPWIIALITTIAGIFINLWISNRQIKSNRKLSLKQIKATLSTNNRQEWITETRNTLSELLTYAKQLNVEFQEKSENIEIKKKLHEKVTINRTKLLLLLNLEKEKHKILYNSMYELISTLDKHLGNKKAKVEHNIIIPNDNGEFLQQMEKVIEDGRALFYDEWRKIQSISEDD